MNTLIYDALPCVLAMALAPYGVFELVRGADAQDAHRRNVAHRMVCPAHNPRGSFDALLAHRTAGARPGCRMVGTRPASADVRADCHAGMGPVIASLDTHTKAAK